MDERIRTFSAVVEHVGRARYEQAWEMLNALPPWRGTLDLPLSVHSRALIGAASSGDPYLVVPMITKLGLDPTYQDPSVESLLRHLLFAGAVDVLKRVMEVTDQAGAGAVHSWTALFYCAAGSGREASLRFVAPFLTSADIQGPCRLAVHECLERSPCFEPGALEFLVAECGLSMSARDEAGRYPVECTNVRVSLTASNARRLAHVLSLGSTIRDPDYREALGRVLADASSRLQRVSGGTMSAPASVAEEVVEMLIMYGAPLPRSNRKEPNTVALWRKEVHPMQHAVRVLEQTLQDDFGVQLDGFVGAVSDYLFLGEAHFRDTEPT